MEGTLPGRSCTRIPWHFGSRVHGAPSRGWGRGRGRGGVRTGEGSGAGRGGRGGVIRRSACGGIGRLRASRTQARVAGWRQGRLTWGRHRGEEGRMGGRAGSGRRWREGSASAGRSGAPCDRLAGARDGRRGPAGAVPRGGGRTRHVRCRAPDRTVRPLPRARPGSRPHRTLDPGIRPATAAGGRSPMPARPGPRSTRRGLTTAPRRRAAPGRSSDRRGAPGPAPPSSSALRSSGGSPSCSHRRRAPGRLPVRVLHADLRVPGGQESDHHVAHRAVLRDFDGVRVHPNPTTPTSDRDWFSHAPRMCGPGGTRSRTKAPLPAGPVHRERPRVVGRPPGIAPGRAGVWRRRRPRRASPGRGGPGRDPQGDRPPARRDPRCGRSAGGRSGPRSPPRPPRPPARVRTRRRTAVPRRGPAPRHQGPSGRSRPWRPRRPSARAARLRRRHDAAAREGFPFPVPDPAGDRPAGRRRRDLDPAVSSLAATPTRTGGPSRPSGVVATRR